MRNSRMKIFSISDLHLSGFKPKPMDIFGDCWADHWDKIRRDWQEKVSDDDVVLIPGDLSWAMKLEEAKIDIDQICALNGMKILLKGNHDFWWSSVSKVKGILTNNTHVLQNSAIEIGDYVVAGTRGWIMPHDGDYDKKNEKIYLREIERLKLSLSSIKSTDKEIIIMTHYPPISEKNMDNAFLDLFKQYGVKHGVYGHLHDASAANSFNGDFEGITFQNVSCDFLDFKLYQVI